MQDARSGILASSGIGFGGDVRRKMDLRFGDADGGCNANAMQMRDPGPTRVGSLIELSLQLGLAATLYVLAFCIELQLQSVVGLAVGILRLLGERIGHALA